MLRLKSFNIELHQSFTGFSKIGIEVLDEFQNT